MQILKAFKSQKIMESLKAKLKSLIQINIKNILVVVMDIN